MYVYVNVCMWLVDVRVGSGLGVMECDASFRVGSMGLKEGSGLSGERVSCGDPVSDLYYVQILSISKGEKGRKLLKNHILYDYQENNFEI